MGHVGNKRKSNISDAEIITVYKSTLSVYKTEKALGVAASTIYRVLERNGVERTGLQYYRQNATRFTREVEQEIRQLYEAGGYYAQLVEKFGGTEYSIKQAIKRAGGVLAPVTPPLTEAEKQQVRTWYASGVSQQKISVRLGRSQSAVSRFLRFEGNIYDPVRGPGHPMWKGGRSKAGAYWRVLVEPDDPMAVMRNGHGYVLEHRLVMARKLGRPLKKTETVHHIDGDPSNNHPDNLQLRQGKHGKHVVMCCGECGSRNIIHAPLD